MDAVEDPLAMLSRALHQTGALISGVRPDQANLPTPCSSWDVRTLVNHTVLDVQGFIASAEGRGWEQRHGDAIGEDRIGSYREAADALTAAWRREGVVGRTMHASFGDVPATWSVGQQVADLVVHGWDISTATGGTTELDTELARVALDWGRANLQPAFRGAEAAGKVFGPEVAVASDAPIYDRLAAFFGRDPG